MVLFHRSHPSDARILLQVPTGQETAETYVIDMDQRPAPVGEYDPRTDHKGWVERLPRSRELLDKLSCDPHVAYYPSNGGASMVLDNPDEIPWVAKVMAFARMQGNGQTMDSYFARRRAGSRQMPMLPVRAAVSRPRLDPYSSFGGL